MLCMPNNPSVTAPSPPQVLYLPLSACGRFYSTAQRGSKGREHVYLMAHLLRTQRLPATVRLICGYMPRVPCNFTGGVILGGSTMDRVPLSGRCGVSVGTIEIFTA